LKLCLNLIITTTIFIASLKGKIGRKNIYYVYSFISNLMDSSKTLKFFSLKSQPKVEFLKFVEFVNCKKIWIDQEIFWKYWIKKRNNFSTFYPTRDSLKRPLICQTRMKYLQRNKKCAPKKKSSKNFFLVLHSKQLITSDFIVFSRP